MPSGEEWARHWPTEHDFEGERPDRIVFVIRSYQATISSQVNRGIASCSEEAEADIMMAHMRSFTWAVSHGIPIYPVIYDSIVDHPERFDHLFFWLGLEPVPCPEAIMDGNARWLS